MWAAAAGLIANRLVLLLCNGATVGEHQTESRNGGCSRSGASVGSYAVLLEGTDPLRGGDSIVDVAAEVVVEEKQTGLGGLVATTSVSREQRASGWHTVGGPDPANQATWNPCSKFRSGDDVRGPGRLTRL